MHPRKPRADPCPCKAARVPCAPQRYTPCSGTARLCAMCLNRKHASTESKGSGLASRQNPATLSHMSRPLRIEFPGAGYHVTARGDRREPIYRDELVSPCLSAEQCKQPAALGRLPSRVEKVAAIDHSKVADLAHRHENGCSQSAMPAASG